LFASPTFLIGGFGPMLLIVLCLMPGTRQHKIFGTYLLNLLTIRIDAMNHMKSCGLKGTNAVYIHLLAIAFFTYAMMPAAGSPPAARAETVPCAAQETVESIAHAPEPALEVETFQCAAGMREEVCQYYEIIVSAALRHEVETPLVMAIIHTESRYNPKALSPRGAQGLMQLMPRTAASLGVVDAFDPEENIDAGVRYFKKMLKKVKGDRELALAAYNAGLRNVQEHGGVPPFPETLNYVRKVQSWYDHYKDMEAAQLPVRTYAALAGDPTTLVSYR
jgi:hypothetical protein